MAPWETKLRWQPGGNYKPTWTICEINWQNCPLAVAYYFWKEMVTDVIHFLTSNNENAILKIILLLFISSIIYLLIRQVIKRRQEKIITKRLLNRIAFDIHDLDFRLNSLIYKIQYEKWPSLQQIQSGYVTQLYQGNVPVSLSFTDINTIKRKLLLKDFLMHYFKTIRPPKNFSKNLVGGIGTADLRRFRSKSSRDVFAKIDYDNLNNKENNMNNDEIKKSRDILLSEKLAKQKCEDYMSSDEKIIRVLYNDTENREIGNEVEIKHDKMEEVELCNEIALEDIKKDKIKDDGYFNNDSSNCNNNNAITNNGSDCKSDEMDKCNEEKDVKIINNHAKNSYICEKPIDNAKILIEELEELFYISDNEMFTRLREDKFASPVGVNDEKLEKKKSFENVKNKLEKFQREELPECKLNENLEKKNGVIEEIIEESCNFPVKTDTSDKEELHPMTNNLPDYSFYPIDQINHLYTDDYYPNYTTNDHSETTKSTENHTVGNKVNNQLNDRKFDENNAIINDKFSKNDEYHKRDNAISDNADPFSHKERSSPTVKRENYTKANANETWPKPIAGLLNNNGGYNECDSYFINSKILYQSTLSDITSESDQIDDNDKNERNNAVNHIPIISYEDLNQYNSYYYNNNYNYERYNYFNECSTSWKSLYDSSAANYQTDDNQNAMKTQNLIDLQSLYNSTFQNTDDTSFIDDFKQNGKECSISDVADGDIFYEHPMSDAPIFNLIDFNVGKNEPNDTKNNNETCQLNTNISNNMNFYEFKPQHQKLNANNSFNKNSDLKPKNNLLNVHKHKNYQDDSAIMEDDFIDENTEKRLLSKSLMDLLSLSPPSKQDCAGDTECSVIENDDKEIPLKNININSTNGATIPQQFKENKEFCNNEMIYDETHQYYNKWQYLTPNDSGCWPLLEFEFYFGSLGNASYENDVNSSLLNFSSDTSSLYFTVGDSFIDTSNSEKTINEQQYSNNNSFYDAESFTNANNSNNNLVIDKSCSSVLSSPSIERKSSKIISKPTKTSVETNEKIKSSPKFGRSSDISILSPTRTPDHQILDGCTTNLEFDADNFRKNDVKQSKLPLKSHYRSYSDMCKSKIPEKKNFLNIKESRTSLKTERSFILQQSNNFNADLPKIPLKQTSRSYSTLQNGEFVSKNLSNSSESNLKVIQDKLNDKNNLLKTTDKLSRSNIPVLKSRLNSATKEIVNKNTKTDTLITKSIKIIDDIKNEDNKKIAVYSGESARKNGEEIKEMDLDEIDNSINVPEQEVIYINIIANTEEMTTKIENPSNSLQNIRGSNCNIDNNELVFSEQIDVRASANPSDDNLINPVCKSSELRDFQEFRDDEGLYE